ncbi:FERM domain-containing protein 8-like [Xyrauchen texanus]|uniref:FERM domain-containing protein 8-like n=1 Tax=Xyrauchen texanus TaxID=154827 RepID=UPI002241F91C|nr:FERM domain-containing protein 8-like [Xyrauchen texanus]
MEGDDGDFIPEPSEHSHSQRGSVASSVTRAQDLLVYLASDSAVHLTLENLGGVNAQELGRNIREVLNIPNSAVDVFAFWFCSPLLELQLKPKHQPYKLCRQWQDLLYRFTEAPAEDISQDEPSLLYKRNVFYPRSKELQIEDEGVLRLLYDEAKMNILQGRYPCDTEQWLTLGALSCAIELGTGLDDQAVRAAIREKKLSSFLPAHVAFGGGFLSTLRGRGGRHTEMEQNLIKEYHSVCSSSASSSTQDPTALLRQYLRNSHTLPYYGCAFFMGEIDKPAQGLLHRSRRKAVNVGISLEGVYVMDVKEKHVLLGLKFNELSWDHSYPETEGDSHILWLEFDGEEAGVPVNKLLKIYSKQSELMSGLIEFCVELRSVGESSATGTDGEVTPSQGPSGQVEGSEKTREKRQGKLRRLSSVVCSRVHSLNTISYVDDGKEIKRLKPKRAASFFTRQTLPPTYSAVEVTENLEHG